MAEFLRVRRHHHHLPGIKPVKVPGTDGFDAMGKPIPMYRRTAALAHTKDMGLSTADAWAVVGAVAEQLERDQPYEAMQASMLYLDLTGTYRLMAVLLTAGDPNAGESSENAKGTTRKR